MVAQVYGLQGNDRQAARWLKETIDWGFPCYSMFMRDAFLDPVRHSASVQKVLAGLKVDWDRYRAALQ